MPRRPPRVAPLAAGLAVGAALLAACGASAGGPDGDPHRQRAGGAKAATGARPALPAICGRLRAQRLGAVAAPALTELSGLALSPDQPGVLWAHNDSGDAARVFALRPDGTALADLAVPGAGAVDWEDVAIGPATGRSRARALFLADIGDNDAVREGVAVYRVPEPQLPASGSTAPATRLAFRYPDGAHDAETLLVEPRTGELAIVTKRFDGASRAYVASPAAVARAAAGATVVLRRGPRIALGLGGAATAGDVSADGRTVAVRTYTGVVAWRKATGETLAAALRRRPCTGRTSLSAEGQGEALALSRDGRSFVTAPEGAGATLRRYARP